MIPLDNATTITIKDNFTEVTIKQDCQNIMELLGLIENAVRAMQYCFKGKLTIEEGEDE